VPIHVRHAAPRRLSHRRTHLAERGAHRVLRHRHSSTRWAKPRTQPPAPSGAPSPQAHPPPRRTRCPPCAQTQTQQHALGQAPHPAACRVGGTLPTCAPPTSQSVAPSVKRHRHCRQQRFGPSPAPSRLPRLAHPPHRRTPHLAERGALRVLRHRHSSTLWAKPRTQPPAPSGAPSPHARPPPRRTRRPPCAQTQTQQHALGQAPHPAACRVGGTLPTCAPPTSQSVAPSVCSNTDTAARVEPSPAPSRLPRRAHPPHRRTPHLAERGALRVLKHDQVARAGVHIVAKLVLAVGAPVARRDAHRDRQLGLHLWSVGQRGRGGQRAWAWGCATYGV